MYSENRSKPRLTRPTPIEPSGCEWNTFCEPLSMETSLQIIGLAELTNTLTIAYSTIQVCTASSETNVARDSPAAR